MESDQAIASSFDVLFVDDICSFLTPRLVAAVKAKGAEVVGVFLSSDGSDAKRRLLECGISDVIETEATPNEFVEKAAAAIAHRVVAAEPSTPHKTGALSVGIVGAAQGVGATELAVSLSTQLTRTTSVALVDADPALPSVAQRLDLSVHPNIRTVLDESLHPSGGLAASIQQAGEVMVVGGVADAAHATPLNRSELSIVVDSMQQIARVVVLDLGPFDRTTAGAFGRLSTTAIVGSADPVGVTRLIRASQNLTEVVGGRRLVLVVNKTPSRPYYQAEIRAEVANALPGLPLVLLPFDRKMNTSNWEGSVADRGAFAKGVKDVARVITEAIDDD